MFPISDFNSQVVGFGGRMFENAPDGDRGSAPTAGAAEPKYLNTARTALYDKGRLLYGLDRAKVAIRQADACVLVEGYADAIMSAQAGVENVVATSGTALTEDHLKIIKRFTNNLILGYDLDLAGENASRRGIDMARAAGFDVRVARPAIAGKDPADIVAADSREWQKATAGAKSIMEFYFDRAFAAGDKNSPAGRKKSLISFCRR
jgi:DNA primase (bacterial type)